NAPRKGRRQQSVGILVHGLRAADRKIIARNIARADQAGQQLEITRRVRPAARLVEVRAAQRIDRAGRAVAVGLARDAPVVGEAVAEAVKPAEVTRLCQAARVAECQNARRREQSRCLPFHPTPLFMYFYVPSRRRAGVDTPLWKTGTVCEKQNATLVAFTHAASCCCKNVTELRSAP